MQSRDVLCCANTYYAVTQENMAERRRTMIANGARPLFRCAQLYKQTIVDGHFQRKKTIATHLQGPTLGSGQRRRLIDILGWRVGWSTATPAVPRALQPLQLITDSQAVPVHFSPPLVSYLGLLAASLRPAVHKVASLYDGLEACARARANKVSHPLTSSHSVNHSERVWAQPW